MVASRGSTLTRLQHGAVLHRFASALPGGSPATRCGADGYTIVDCVYHEHNNTYYVLDLLCWAGHALCERVSLSESVGFEREEAPTPPPHA